MYGFCIKSVCVYKYFFFPFSPYSPFPKEFLANFLLEINADLMGKRRTAQGENGKKENMRKKIMQFNSFKKWS